MRYRPPSDEDPSIDPLEELEEEPLPSREERPPPVILWGAAIGLLIGIVVWGSLTLSAVSGVTGLFNDSGPKNVEGTVVPAAEVSATPVNCAELAGSQAMSPEEQAAFASQCLTPTPEPGATPANATVNREDCDAIRGTDYRSQEERQWFLDNCVRH